MKIEALPVEAVKEKLDRGEKVIFLDTSSADSWERIDSQIPGSRHVELEQIEAQLRDFPDDAVVITYAANGEDDSSNDAARHLLQLGWHDVHSLDGGLEAWKNAGLPTERKHDSFPTH